MERLKPLWLILCLLALPFHPSSAVELSLEENRAQRGNIGYVDMQKVFKLYPETTRAKENFAEVVRQAEEQLNLRKAEILRLRAELSGLKYDRQEHSKKPAPAPPAPPPVLPLPLPSPATAALTVAVSTEVFSTSTAAVAAATSTVAASTTALIANLPGLTTTQTPVPSAEPKKGLLAYSDASPAHHAPSADLDAKIEQKAADLALKEKTYRDHQHEVEKNLLDLESRRSEILLGKIHRVVKEVAIKEGVSVVVDKGAILYGQDAVDLTDRVLKSLKGS